MAYDQYDESILTAYLNQYLKNNPPSVPLSNEQYNELYYKYSQTDEARLLLEASKSSADQVYESSNATFENEVTERIIGNPILFTEEVDPPMGSINGRVYTEMIQREAPLVFIQPGEPSFLPDTKDKSLQAKLLNGFNNDDLSSDIIGNFDKDIRYFGFKPRLMEYFNYVNALVTFTANVMNLDKEDMEYYLPDGSSKGNYSNFLMNEYLGVGLLKGNFSEAFHALLTNDYITYYLDVPNSSFSESASNQTGESNIAQALKGGSDVKKEIDFLFGANTSNRLSSMENAEYNQSVEEVMKLVNNDKNIFERLGSQFTTIKAGGNLLLPEIWKESSFGKSYSLSFSFSTPYGDNASILQHVFIPFLSLLAFTLPRAVTSAGYGAPFLIKAFSKGYFNCDYGIVESLNIRKGGADPEGWTQEDLPTSITIDMTIRDLYSTIMMASIKNMKAFSMCTGLMDYLKTLGAFDFRSADQAFIQKYSYMLDMALRRLSPSVKIDEMEGRTYQTIKGFVDNLLRI